MLEEIAARQGLAVTRAQAVAAGMSVDAIRHQLATGRWQRPVPGVYCTFDGPVPRESYLSAVALHCGAGAVLSHETAAELHGLADEPSRAVHVTVPTARRVRGRTGLVLHRSGRLAAATQPARWPPRTRIEETVLDLTQASDERRQVIDWIARACARRFTTAARLRSAVESRPKLRWRAVLTSVLADVEHGCHSVLEVCFLSDVERAHCLPAGRRQVAVMVAEARQYQDVTYDAFNLCVELDGRLAHQDDARVRDRRRDNASTERGVRTVRYGWHEVIVTPCAVAAQLARLLHSAGWPGRVRRCPRCPPDRNPHP